MNLSCLSLLFLRRIRRRAVGNPLLLAASVMLGGIAGANVSLHAETGGPVHLTFDQAVAEALRANPGLRARTQTAAAAASDARAANRSRLGELDAVANYGYYNDDQILRPMSRELTAGGIASLPWDRSQLHYGVAYQVPLFVGGQLVNRIAVAKLEARKADALREGTHWQVRFNAVSLYAAAQALDRVEAALREQVKALQQTKSDLDEMVATGKRPEVDRLKVLDELAAAQAQFASAQADRTKVGSLLLALLGRDPSGRIAVDPLPAAMAPPVIDHTRLKELVMAASSVRIARLSEDQAARAVAVARSAFLPKVVGTASYQENTGLNIDRTLDTWGLSVGVVVPLFSGGADVQRLQAAKERRAAGREALAQAQLQAGADLQEALARLKAAQVGVRSAEARVVATNEAARIEQVRYATGAGTIEDLLRAIARREGAGAALAAARADRITAAARINTLAEKEILQ